MTLSNEIKKYLSEQLKCEKKLISIKHQWAGYSEAYWIKIDKSLNLDEAQRLVNKYQQYDRDERTGEILEGGNTYLFVNYA